MSSLFLHVIKLFLGLLTEAESSNVFVDPMLGKPPKELALIKTVKSNYGENVPVDHIWKFDLEEYKLRNFGRKINFSKIRIEPVMLNFLAKTENLRNRRSEQPIYNRGKVLEKSSGKLLFAISRYKTNASRAVLS